MLSDSTEPLIVIFQGPVINVRPLFCVPKSRAPSSSVNDPEPSKLKAGSVPVVILLSPGFDANLGHG